MPCISVKRPMFLTAATAELSKGPSPLDLATVTEVTVPSGNMPICSTTVMFLRADGGRAHPSAARARIKSSKLPATSSPCSSASACWRCGVSESKSARACAFFSSVDLRAASTAFFLAASAAAFFFASSADFFFASSATAFFLASSAAFFFASSAAFFLASSAAFFLASSSAAFLASSSDFFLAMSASFFSSAFLASVAFLASSAFWLHQPSSPRLPFWPRSL